MLKTRQRQAAGRWARRLLVLLAAVPGTAAVLLLVLADRLSRPAAHTVGLRIDRRQMRVEGAAHVDLHAFQPVAYEARVLHFLAQHLRAAPPANP